jgi:predicted transcriptional regulator of viral defense system
MMWEQRFSDLSAVAARQNGMVTGAQAERIGVDESALHHFAESGLVLELDWNVYQLPWGSLGPRYAYPYAAWLALSPESFRWERPQQASEDAVLSHESACGLHGLGSMPSPEVIFTAPEARQEPRATKVHVAPLRPEDVTTVEHVPVMTPHRTVIDLVADGTDHGELRRILMDALLKDLVELRAIHQELAPLAQRCEFPAGGREFVEYFIPDITPSLLSPRNIRGYAALVFPARVASLQVDVARLLPVQDEVLSWEIAAEIVGQIGSAL